MLTKKEKEKMKKYRYLIAAMIDESLGYFTPEYALRAIKAYKDKRAIRCEWYLDIAGLGHGKNLWEIEDNKLKEINHDVISQAYKNHKKRRKNIRECLKIVDKNINGRESIGASYF